MTTSRQRLLLTLVALALSLTLLLPSVFAQQATGKILGTVTDPSGAVLPGVNVTVTSTATGITYNATTDKDGMYQVLNLPIGTYKIHASHQGFKTVDVVTTPLEINQFMRMDLHLEVGTTAESVTVEAANQGVETVNPTLGGTITGQAIQQMPLNGRNVLQLAMMEPGVTETNGNSNGTSNSQAGTYSIAGQKSDSVTYLLDGGLNNDLLSNGVVYNPNPDTVAEFRILKSDYSAEYGRNAGGIVSVVTKSGTNAIHGSAYDFLRNDYFNANSYFNKENNVPRDVLKRNQFGGTLGGPLKKDKIFWFVGYQGQRLTHQETSPAGFSVFTPAELQGDFSHSGPGGTPDPGVVAYLQANPIYQSNPALAAQGIIDPAAIDPVAQAYIKAGMIPSSATGKLTTVGSQVQNNNELTTKWDFVVTPKDRLGVTLGMLKYPNTNPFSGGSYLPQFGISGRNDRYFSNFSYTHTFSSALLNEAHFTAQRGNNVQSVPITKQPTPAQLGIGITPDQSTGPTRLGFASGLTIGFSPQGPTSLVDNTFLVSDSVSWVHGKHTLKFGGLYSPYQNNTLYDFYVDGEFDFYGPDGSFSGNDYADFLMGNADEYFQFGAAPSNIRSKSYAAFVQDEWHLRSNLVITYGLRYEYNSPKLDTKGRSFSLRPGFQSTRFINAPLGLLFPGDSGAPKGANFPDRNDFAPRFGVAWDPHGDGKWSVRAGWGVFYDVLKGEDNLQYNGQAPFFGFADVFPSPAANGTSGALQNPYVATGQPNPFPSKPPAQNIDFNAAGFLPFGGGGVFFVDPHLRTPYTYQYNLTIQHDLGQGMTLETGYVGSSTHKQTALVDTNPFILGSKTRVYNVQPGVQVPYAFSYLDTFENVANANYNSFQTSLRKMMGNNNRWFGGSYFTMGYTWAKSIDTASGFRNNSSRVPFYNHNLFRAVSDYDIQQRLSFAGNWDLPLAEAFGHSNRLTKGWSVRPIFSVRSGFPIDVRGFLSRSRTRWGPSAAGDGSMVHPNLNNANGAIAVYDPHNLQTINGNAGNFWFNPADLNINGLKSTYTYGAPDDPATHPNLRTYGTMPRNYLRGPHRTNLDFTLAKDTAITERVHAEFQAQAFNVFNFAEWTDPNTSYFDSQFGQITNTADPRIMQFALRISF